MRTLMPLEERLVSPRINSPKIWQIGYGKCQTGPTGTIINVLAYLDQVQIALPSSLSDSMTLQ